MRRSAWLPVFAGFALLCLAIYRDACEGPFVSDDLGYLVTHPYTDELSLAKLGAVFDPFGPAKHYTANYAPVHLLLTTLEREIFADDPLGYHLVNVFVHALCATLLVALLRASRLAIGPALLGGALFAVHPAAVEAVAWASQLKTNGSLAFSLAALLAFRTRPALATLLFVLALLTKASAAFALPMVAAFVWAWGADSERRERAPLLWRWVGVWTLVFALYAVPQFGSFAQRGAVAVPEFADPMLHLRTVAAVGGRYLVMAATSLGVSAFHEPPPSRSVLDPWFLFSAAAAVALGWRLLATLLRRREEAAWWVGAAAAFAPVSQVFPFLVPLADRYLYFILPGLIGGALLAARELGERLPRRVPLAAGVAVVALVAVFAYRAQERARLWRSETLLLLDAARHYPDGATAHLLRARSAAREGDAAGAVALLRIAADRGIDRYAALDGDPGLAPIRDDPLFRDFVRELAGRFIERVRARAQPTQAELRAIALAHLARDEADEAAAAYRQALVTGGPLDDAVRAELAQLLERRGAAAEARRGR
jgi:hypothetical protein